MDASKEDGWFEALRHLIFHLQERRVWMPEFPPDQPISDILLFPMQNCNLEPQEGDLLKVFIEKLTKLFLRIMVFMMRHWKEYL